MGTISQKLLKVQQSKNAIKNILLSKLSGIFQSSTIFADYADYIDDYLVYPQGTLDITAIGTYDVTDKKYVALNIPVEKHTITVTIGSSATTSISFTGFEHIPRYWNLGLRTEYAPGIDDKNKYITAGVSIDPYSGVAQMEEAAITGNGNNKRLTIYHDPDWSWSYNNTTDTLTIINNSKDLAYFAPNTQYALSYYVTEHLE